MRTAISECERELVEYCVADFLRAREVQQAAADKLAEVLGVGVDDAIDTLNIACNAQAALDQFGVEVIPNAVTDQVAEPEDVFADLASGWMQGLFFALALWSLIVGAILYVV